ncbi:DUF7336 domain-containing protein [Nocardia sp. CA-128927]|uniref:DUF7336 domain-containing protein n=1 Tax=Nocardia sp. CA-128927 TaxID=3239975 RepID=UPI003D99D2CC
MNYVYLVNHEYQPEGGDCDVKEIGVYSSEVEAQAAIERLSPKPGFQDHPDSFVVHRYEIDKDYWTEGFVEQATIE